ncbi:hypothetical protein ACFLXC_00720 [Chloroflexota bacterium]
MGSFTIAGKRREPIGLFGPCIVMERKQYLASGGHALVKRELVEDLALGEQLKRQKIPIFNFGGKGTISFRMYPNGLRELVDGWSKGFATGAVKTPWMLLVTIVAWLGGGLGTVIYLLESLLSANPLLIILWSAFYLFYFAQIYWMLSRIGNFKIYSAFFHPVLTLFFMAVFLISVISIYVKKSVRWKGRTVNLKEDD